MELPLIRGALCVSIDLELLWGVWDTLSERAIADCELKERVISARLCDLFDRYEMPATWATVGRLFERPTEASQRGSSECWHAPDIIALLRSAQVPHDIGSHSFSHIYFDECSRETVRLEMEHARLTHEAHGLPFHSFVFPRNKIAHLDVVADSGITVFRSHDAGLLRQIRRRAPRAYPAFNLATKAVPTAPPVVLPRLWRDGTRELVEIPSSLLLLGRGGARAVVPISAMRTKLRRGVRRAAAEQKVFHLWFHPSNFYDEMDTQFGLLEACLAEAKRLRDQGKLDVLTMSDFASRRPRRRTTTLAAGYASRAPTDDDRNILADFTKVVQPNGDPDRLSGRWWWAAAPKQAVIAVDRRSGSVAAICAGRAHRLRVGDATVDATAICDWFVSPDHKGKGLGIALAQELTGSVQAATTLSISDDAVAGFLKMGWTPSPPVEVPFHVAPLRGLLSRIVSAPADATTYDVGHRTFEGPHAIDLLEFDDLWNACRRTKSVAMVRDGAALHAHLSLVANRRYRLACARRDGRLVGYMLSRDLRRGAFPRLGPARITLLSDFLTADGCDDAFEPLLRETMRAAANAGQDLALGLSTYPRYKAVFARTGFLSSGESALGLRIRRLRTRFMYQAPVGLSPDADAFYLTALDSDMDYSFGADYDR